MKLLILRIATVLALQAPLVLHASNPACPPSPSAWNCLQKAIRSLPPEGGVVLLGAGVYGLEQPLQVDRDGVTLQGAGEDTVLLRLVTVSGGEGLVNVRARRVTIRDLRIDGNVREPEGIAYADPGGGKSVHGSPIHGDPMHDELLRNTSVTVHRGAAELHIEDVVVEYTGGYAVLIDARYGDIREVAIRNSTFRDNRPHVFGRPGDLRYGSWTGGIHYQNDGRDLPFARFALRGLIVEDCVFERGSGHAIWGHGYGFETLNEDVVIRGNRFQDIGMDAVMIGNTRRATVENNELRRIGYVAPRDDDRARPAWYPGMSADGADNIPAVGIDTSGLVTDSVYRGNRMLNVNGHCIDLDGFTRGEVTGNTMRVSGREDAYTYALDQVAEFGGLVKGNFSKGINLSNTAGAAPTVDVRIVNNTILNMGGFAIALHDSQNCVVEGNHIRHYGQIYGPVMITNSLREPVGQHTSHHNIVRDNYIHFYLEAWCVTEADDLGGGPKPVTGPNYVYGNTCADNTHGEFLKGAQSRSVNGPPPAAH